MSDKRLELSCDYMPLPGNDTILNYTCGAYPAGSDTRGAYVVLVHIQHKETARRYYDTFQAAANDYFELCKSFAKYQLI